MYDLEVERALSEREAAEKQHVEQQSAATVQNGERTESEHAPVEQPKLERSRLEEESRAATKIQALQRGRSSRKRGRGIKSGIKTRDVTRLSVEVAAGTGAAVTADQVDADSPITPSPALEAQIEGEQSKQLKLATENSGQVKYAEDPTETADIESNTNTAGIQSNGSLT